MKRMHPLLLTTLLLAGCKQYSAVDLSFLREASIPADSKADRGKMISEADAVITAIVAKGRAGTRHAAGDLVMIQTNKCERKEIQRFVDGIRSQYGLRPTRWGP